MNVLITGGAGFIGVNLTRRFLQEGWNVSILDNFSSQVHAGGASLAADLTGQVRLFRGDVRDRNLVTLSLAKQDAVVHLAAETGTGQSMYEIRRYQDVNIGGTATILDVLMNQEASQVRKFLVASSRAVYGEGKYHCQQHGTVYPGRRDPEDLRARFYEVRCPVCRVPCDAQATSEDSPLSPLSFYAVTKQVQEQMVLMCAHVRGFSAHALRYQNVYGPGQSLCNPYTGILAIFSTLAQSNSPIEIFEDGQESRDFVYVDDVVEATLRCIKADTGVQEVLNVGTGRRTTVVQVAEEIIAFFGSKSDLLTTGAFRQGDIRHNFADLSDLRQAIQFEPRVNFREGLHKFLDWVAMQEKVPVRYAASLQEMRERGLLHG